MKTNACYRVIKRDKANRRLGITSDQTIWLIGTKWGDYPVALRRVGYRDKQTGKHYVFLTNNFDLSARTIADIYKDRWRIETFFATPNLLQLMAPFDRRSSERNIYLV